jgi:hypothetical protein
VSEAQASPFGSMAAFPPSQFDQTLTPAGSMTAAMPNFSVRDSVWQWQRFRRQTVENGKTINS